MLYRIDNLKKIKNFIDEKKDFNLLGLYNLLFELNNISKGVVRLNIVKKDKNEEEVLVRDIFYFDSFQLKEWTDEVDTKEKVNEYLKKIKNRTCKFMWWFSFIPGWDKCKIYSSVKKEKNVYEIKDLKIEFN